MRSRLVRVRLRFYEATLVEPVEAFRTVKNIVCHQCRSLISPLALGHRQSTSFTPQLFCGSLSRSSRCYLLNHRGVEGGRYIITTVVMSVSDIEILDPRRLINKQLRADSRSAGCRDTDFFSPHWSEWVLRELGLVFVSRCLTIVHATRPQTAC